VDGDFAWLLISFDFFKEKPCLRRKVMSYTISKEVEVMEKHRAIPHGYMTAGEIAKKMD